MWFIIWWPVWLTIMQQALATQKPTNSFYTAISTKQTLAALNCTSSIPASLSELMHMHEPPNDPTGGQVLAEYLLACLHQRLPRRNERSPFSHVAQPQINYDITLNQVVSLGFDGTLITKALHLMK